MITDAHFLLYGTDADADRRTQRSSSGSRGTWPMRVTAPVVRFPEA
jgi:hypothetical protein